MEGPQARLGELKRLLQERSTELERRQSSIEERTSRDGGAIETERSNLLKRRADTLTEAREQTKAEIQQEWEDRLNTSGRQFERELASLRGEVDRLTRATEDWPRAGLGRRPGRTRHPRARDELAARLEGLEALRRQRHPRAAGRPPRYRDLKSSRKMPGRPQAFRGGPA